MSEEEKGVFQAQSTEVLIRHEDDPPASEGDHLARIIAAHGRPLHPRHRARIIEAAVVSSPLAIIQPVQFARNYRRLAALANGGE